MQLGRRKNNGSDEANTYSVVSNGKNRLEAKKKLARLIHQDVANNDVLPLQPKKKQIPIVHRQVKPLTGSSASNFVTDLRSERKQLRKGWDQLEQPRKKEPLFTWPKNL
jgi:hypothetical protein